MTIPTRGHSAFDSLLNVARGIDRISGFFANIAFWLLLLVVLIAAANATLRWLDPYFLLKLTSNRMNEAQWQLFGIAFMLAGAHALREGAHVRVDVLYDRLSIRLRAWINVIGHGFFLLPFCAWLLWASWSPVFEAWRIGEYSGDAEGLPLYPVKTVVPFGFALLAMQALAQLIKHVATLRGLSTTDEAESS